MKTDQEHLLGGEVARAVERVLGVARLLDISLGAPPRRLLVETVLEIGRPVRVDRRVENMRAGRDHLCEPRRGTEHVAEQFAHVVVGPQDRQELDRGAHPGHRPVEGGKRGVGVAGTREGFEQRRRQLRQHLAGARAAHRWPPAEMPAADRLGRRFRMLEAEPAQASRASRDRRRRR